MKSLFDHMNWKSAQETRAGFKTGTITCQSVPSGLHPLIFAASSSSFGTFLRN